MGVRGNYTAKNGRDTPLGRSKQANKSAELTGNLKCDSSKFPAGGGDTLGWD